MTQTQPTPSPGTTTIDVPRQVGRVLPAGVFGHRAVRIVERNVMAYRRQWMIFMTGLIEPFLFLLSIGIGVGALVRTVPGPGGHPVDYDVFVAPGLLAASAMNGAVFDTTFNFFAKFKYMHTYDAMLATPLRVRDVAQGEVAWAVLRGGIYSTAFLVTMVAFGLVPSWWAVLSVPVAILIGYAFAGAGLASTTWMRSFVDFDYVNLVIIPLFLFSATFFPLTRYPHAMQWVVRATPLYQGVALERSLVLGHMSWVDPLHALYLVAMGTAGVRIATARLSRLLQP